LTTPIDCIGEWGSWGQCTTDCVKKRYYTITRIAENGGRQCAHLPGASEDMPCDSNKCCRLLQTDCQQGSVLDIVGCKCLCKPGWGGQTCSMKETDAQRVKDRFGSSLSLSSFSSGSNS
jgi:hypothetical protein